MALKNLVAQKAKLTEEAIEAIVSDYVRYDVDEREIVFTPAAAGLSNKAKVLIFLVAQQGWQFVLDDAIDVEVPPSRMEELLGIPGGTLRPVLKDLKDRNLLAAKSGNYSVRSTSLDAIKAELDGKGSAMARPKKKTAKTKADVAVDDQADAGPSDEAPAKRSNRGSRSGPGLGEAFDKMVANGFFDEGRASADVKARFHEQAIIIKPSSLPQYLLAAVRDGRLTREKRDVNGKQVWVYTTAK